MLTGMQDVGEGHVPFGKMPLERHAISAIQYACQAALDRSSDPGVSEISASDILLGVLAVAILEEESLSGTSAFRSFAALIPGKVRLSGAGKLETPVEPAMLPYEPELAVSLTMAIRHLAAAGRSRFWGRDLVTAALLADSASLGEFAPWAGIGLVELRDRWSLVLQEDQDFTRADWPTWWSDRGLNFPLSYATARVIDPSRHPLEAGIAPSWASGWGEDFFGPFVHVDVQDASMKLRWIPPGQFDMGSPETEQGRYEAEGPLTPVTFAEGFWLMDTPVTQALWMAVMGENPSRFQDPERPVESVTWQDAQDFLERLNGRVRGLELRLPSEAEWEYACRAGTSTATYAGPMEIAGENNAPVLDAIAWYGGNSGLEYDLDEAHDSNGWPEKQYPHSRAGTRKVGKKRPNAWGCHDMLGNVWEWCEDIWVNSHADADPLGGARQASQQEDGSRVVRGGSWLEYARYVRAAYRNSNGPGPRYGNLGFRCARGQVSTGRQGPGRGRKAELRPAAGPAASGLSK